MNEAVANMMASHCPAAEEEQEEEEAGGEGEEEKEEIRAENAQHPLSTAIPDEIVSCSSASQNALCLTPCRRRQRKSFGKLCAILHAIYHLFPAPLLGCKSLARAAGRRSAYLGSSAATHVLIGTLFGQRKGHVHFAVQDDPHAPPLLFLELATPTNVLVKEMASGLVRIALECERTQNRGKLLLEQVWTMYCNGRKTGYAIRRECSDADFQVFSLVRAVSMGAGVLPMRDEGIDGELMYMRAKFERIVGSRDSEAFYMLNPDGTGGPELSIFLLRI
ncbi:hypothetical protein KP509_24G061100 [Ceratopteris richardii]|uniref:Protein MIZU-KUSSEI 1 n=1 Tax=Ceratopteris richardii TaxID=49495 RepID=A0A8T2RY68_CERRI|nr:hypothetical protein KP509_24G061100 [Ceratopteris richardii]